MSQECGAATPLIELLERVPRDIRAEWREGEFCYASAPVGAYCHDAASEIRYLKHALERSQDAYRNMREFAESRGLDTTCYGEKENA